MKRRFYFILFISCYSFVLSAQVNKLDNLESLLLNEEKNSLKVKLLNEISEEYLKSDYEKSISYAKQALDLSELLNSNTEKAKSLSLLGKGYMYLGLNEQAIIYFFESLDLYKELQDSIGITRSYCSLGTVNWFLNEFDQALSYFKETSIFYEQKKDSAAIISSYLNMGICYYVIQQNDSANYFLDKALGYSIKLKKHKTIGVVLMQMASITFKERDFKTTFEILQEIENKYLNLLDIADKGEFYCSISDYYLAISDYQNVEKYLLKLHSVAKQSGSMELLKYYYDSKFKLESHTENYKEAIQDLIKFNQYQDSLIDLNYNRKIENLGKLREVERKESEISLLKKNNQLQNVKIAESKKLQRLYILVSALLFILVIIIYRSFHLNKKRNDLLNLKNKELNSQKEKIETTAEQLIEKNKDLLKLNTVKDKFYSIISHDLRGSVGNIKGFSDLLKERYDVLPEDKKKKYVSLISKSGNSTLNLLNNLLDWSRSQQDKIAFNPEKINLHDLVSNVLYYTAPIAAKKNISTFNKLDENTFVFGDNGMIFTILRNLVSNAIKFTSTGGNINFFAEKKEDYITIHVKDNGVGISEDVLAKLFKTGEMCSTLGTENESGTGMGLLLCKEFISKHDQNIGVVSSLGIGSDFWFTLEFPEKD
ncbi:MAG: tetratricopeptide repeat protein [Bacteroidales bacterium]|nr:tetratricopeptide repeat protein [Bacteroidales bacterium]